MGKKASRTYFSYPTTPDERRAAFTTFEFAKENNLQRPQYLDDTGNVWRWDNKGNGKHGLINTDLKSARNGRDKARRVGLSLTADNYEDAFPGMGQELYDAEKARIDQIYKSADDSQDVDHIWSMSNGGLNVSNNLRPLDSRQNRSEGNRPIPSDVEQAAYMMADTKQDQVRLQGPRFPQGSRTELFYQGGKVAVRLLNRSNPIVNGHDLFMAGKNGEDLANGAAEYLPGMKPNPETDLGKRAGDAIVSGAKEAFTNSKKAIDQYDINTI